MWTIHYMPAATAGIRKVPRGPAADVTAAIAALQRVPIPNSATPDPTGRANTYVISVAGYNITYELLEAQRIIRILTVEQA
jgi:hypothetical protein